MQEFEDKEVAKWDSRKCMKRKGEIFLGGRRDETQNGSGSLGAGIEKFGKGDG